MKPSEPCPEQELLLCDAQGRVTGRASREACHRGRGLRHLAVFLVARDGAGRWLLQHRRSHLWDGWWDLAGATHPIAEGSHVESVEEAARRCLRDEWGVSDGPLRRLFAFNYEAPHGDWAENEHCVVYETTLDDSARPDPRHAHDVRWVETDALRREAAQDGARFTPWCLITLERLGLVGAGDAGTGAR